MSGPTVTLTFTGDEKDLTKSFDNVGKSSDQMNESLTKTSKDIKSHQKAFENMGETTDVSEKKFIGFHDVVDGVASGLEAWKDPEASLTDKTIALAQSAADLAGGLTDFLIPAVSSVTTFMRGPLASAMSFIAAHPLIIALVALAAIFVVLWTNSETFRKIVIDAFNAVGGFIKDVFGGVIRWLVDAFNGVVDFFTKIPERIGQAFSTLGAFIANAFKAGVNVLVDAMNWFLDHTLNWLIDRANDVIRWVPGVPYIPRIPHIPRMHAGGLVPGMPGDEVPIIARAGERVITEDQGWGGGYRIVAHPAADSLTGNFINTLARRGWVSLTRVAVP